MNCIGLEKTAPTFVTSLKLHYRLQNTVQSFLYAIMFFFTHEQLVLHKMYNVSIKCRKH